MLTKVERSGRRGARWGVVAEGGGGAGMLCSTWNGLLAACKCVVRMRDLAFVGGHLVGPELVLFGWRFGCRRVVMLWLEPRP